MTGERDRRGKKNACDHERGVKSHAPRIASLEGPRLARARHDEQFLIEIGHTLIFARGDAEHRQNGNVVVDSANRHKTRYTSSRCLTEIDGKTDRGKNGCCVRSRAPVLHQDTLPIIAIALGEREWRAQPLRGRASRYAHSPDSPSRRSEKRTKCRVSRADIVETRIRTTLSGCRLR